MAVAVTVVAEEDIGGNSSFFQNLFVHLHTSGELAHLVERPDASIGKVTKTISGISSSGRAFAWHAKGDRFDPGILHKPQH